MTLTYPIPWIWKDETMFGPASQYYFLEQLSQNETNSTVFDMDMQHFEENPIETIFGLSTGVVLLIDMLFCQKNKEHGLPERNLQKFTNNISQLKNLLLYFTLSLLISPIILILYIIFFFYRLFVILILKLQYGDEFAGLLEGNDVTWAVEDNSKSIISILLLVENNNVDLLQKLKEFFLRIAKTREKIFYHREYKYGYYFWKKNQKVNIENHVKKIDTKGRCLQVVLEENCNRSLPENHSTSWEVLLGDEIEENNLVPVILKVHHSLADGINLLSFLNEDLHEEIRITPHVPIGFFHQLRSFLTSSCTSFLHFIIVVFTAFGFTVRQFFIREQKPNFLHGPQPSEDKLIEFLLEGEYSTFDAIKRIKRRIPDCSFSDVILTALSSALYKYYKKNSSDRPEFLTVVIPIHMSLLKRLQQKPEYTRIESRSQEVSDTSLANEFSMMLFNLPMFSDTENINLLQRLDEIKCETGKLKHSSDVMISYLGIKVAAKYLPVPIIGPSLLAGTKLATTSFSNVPGCCELNLFGGTKVKEVLFWLPNKGYTGVGISVFSYNNKMQLGILVDKIFINNREDAREILMNIESSIRDMDELTGNMYTTQV